MQVSMSNLRIWVIFISAKRNFIRHMNAKPKLCMHRDFKVTTTIVRNMDIEPLNADPNPCGHQISQQEKEAMDTFIIGITTQDKVVIIIKNMDISLRTTLGHTLVEITTDG